MNKLELRVQQHPGTIELNFEELNAALDAKLAEYEGAIFTEDSKDIAKVEIASLRKLKKDIEDARKLSLIHIWIYFRVFILLWCVRK